MSSSDEEDANYFNRDRHVLMRSRKFDQATPGVSGQDISRIMRSSYFGSQSSTFLTHSSDDVTVLDDVSECSFGGFSDVSDGAFEGFAPSEVVGVGNNDDSDTKTNELVSDRVDFDDADEVDQDDDISSVNSEWEQNENVDDPMHFHKVFKYLGLNKHQGSLSCPVVESQDNHSRDTKLKCGSVHDSEQDSVMLSQKLSNLKEVPATGIFKNVSNKRDSVQFPEKSNALCSSVKGSSVQLLVKQPCKQTEKKSNFVFSSKKGKPVRALKKNNSGQLSTDTNSVQSFWRHVSLQPSEKTDISFTKRHSSLSTKSVKPTVPSSKKRQPYKNLISSRGWKSLISTASGSKHCENSEKRKSSPIAKNITQNYGKSSRQRQIPSDVKDDKLNFDQCKTSEIDLVPTKQEVNVEIKEENFDINKEDIDDCEFIGIYCNQVGCTISWLESMASKTVNVTRGMVYELDEFAKKICWERSDVAKWIMRLRGILDAEPTEDDLLEIHQVVKRRKALSVTLAGRKAGFLKLQEYDTGKFILPSTVRVEVKDLNIVVKTWDGVVDRGVEGMNTNERKGTCDAINAERKLEGKSDMKLSTTIRKSGRNRKPSIRVREYEMGKVPSQGMSTARLQSVRKRHNSDSSSAGSNVGTKRFPSASWLVPSRKVNVTDTSKNLPGNRGKHPTSTDDDQISYYHHGDRIYPRFKDISQDLGKCCQAAGLTVDDLNSLDCKDIRITQGIIVELYKFYTKQDCALVYLAEALRKFDKKFAVNTFWVEKAILRIVKKTKKSPKFMDKEVQIEKYTYNPRKQPTHIRKCVSVNKDPRVSYFMHAGYVYPYFKETSHELGKYCKAVGLTVNDLNSVHDKEIYVTKGAVLELNKFYRSRGCSLIFLARRLSKFVNHKYANAGSIKTKISNLTRDKRRDEAFMRQMFFLPIYHSIKGSIKASNGCSSYKSAKTMQDLDRVVECQKVKTDHKIDMKSHRIKKDPKVVVKNHGVKKGPKVYNYYQKKYNYPFFEDTNYFLGKYCYEAGVSVDDLNNRDVKDVQVTQGMVLELYKFYLSQRCPIKWLIEKLWNFRRAPPGTSISMYICIRRLVVKTNENDVAFMSAPFHYPKSENSVQAEDCVKQDEGQEKDDIETENAEREEMCYHTEKKATDSTSSRSRRKVIVVKHLTEANVKGKVECKSRTSDSGVNDTEGLQDSCYFRDRYHAQESGSKCNTVDRNFHDGSKINGSVSNEEFTNTSKTAGRKANYNKKDAEGNALMSSENFDLKKNKRRRIKVAIEEHIEDAAVENEMEAKSMSSDSGVETAGSLATCDFGNEDLSQKSSSKCRLSGLHSDDNELGISKNDKVHRKVQEEDESKRNNVHTEKNYGRKGMDCSANFQESSKLYDIKEDNGKMNTLTTKKDTNAVGVSELTIKRRLSESDVDCEGLQDICCSEDASNSEESRSKFQIVNRNFQGNSGPVKAMNNEVMIVQEDVCKENNIHTKKTYKKNVDRNIHANLESYDLNENKRKRRKVIMEKYKKDVDFEGKVEGKSISDSDEDTDGLQSICSSEDGNLTLSNNTGELQSGNEVESEDRENEPEILSPATTHKMKVNNVLVKEDSCNAETEHNIQISPGRTVFRRNSDMHDENDVERCEEEGEEKESRCETTLARISQSIDINCSVKTVQENNEISKKNIYMKENFSENDEHSNDHVSTDGSVMQQNTEMLRRIQIGRSEWASKDRKSKREVLLAAKIMKIQEGNEIIMDTVQTKENYSKKDIDCNFQQNSSGLDMHGQTAELTGRNKNGRSKLLIGRKKSERIKLKSKNMNQKLKNPLAGMKKGSGGRVSVVNRKDGLQCPKRLNKKSATPSNASMENEKVRDFNRKKALLLGKNDRVSFSNIEGRTLPHFTETDYFLGSHCQAAGLTVEDLNSRDPKDVHLTNGVVLELLNFYLDRHCTFTSLADRLLRFKKIYCSKIVHLVTKLNYVLKYKNEEKLKQEFKFPPAVHNVSKTTPSHLNSTKAKRSSLKTLKKFKKRLNQANFQTKKPSLKSKKNPKRNKQLKKKKSCNRTATDLSTCEFNGGKNVVDIPFVEKEVENAKGKVGSVTRADIVLLYVNWLRRKKGKSGSGVFVSDLLQDVANLLEERKVLKMRIPAGMLMSSSVKLHEEYKRMWQTSKDDALLYLEEDWLEDIQYLVSFTQPSRRNTNDGEDGPENAGDGRLPETQVVGNAVIHSPSHRGEDNLSDDSSFGCLRIEDSGDTDNSDSCGLTTDTVRDIEKIGHDGNSHGDRRRHSERVDEKHENQCEVSDYPALKEGERQMCRKKGKKCTYELADSKETLEGNDLTYESGTKEDFAQVNTSANLNSSEKRSDFLKSLIGDALESKPRDDKENEKEHEQSFSSHSNEDSSTIAGTDPEEQRTLRNADKGALVSEGASQPNMQSPEFSDGASEAILDTRKQVVDKTKRDIGTHSIQKSGFRTTRNLSVLSEKLSNMPNCLASKESGGLENIIDYRCSVDENLKRQVSYLVHFSGSKTEKDTWINEKDLHCSESVLNLVSSTCSVVKGLKDKLKWQSVKPHQRGKHSRKKESLGSTRDMIENVKQSADSTSALNDKENFPTASDGGSESKAKEEFLTVGALLQLYDKWRRGNQSLSDSKTSGSVNVKPLTDEFEKLLSSKGIKNEYSQSLLQSCFVLTLRRRMLHSEETLRMFLDQNCLPVLKASSAQKSCHGLKSWNIGDKIKHFSSGLANMQQEFTESRKLRAKRVLQLHVVEQEVISLERLCRKGIARHQLFNKAVRQEINNINQTLQNKDNGLHGNKTPKALSLAKQCSFDYPEIYEKTAMDLLKSGVAKKEVDNVMDIVLTVVGDTVSSSNGGSV